VNLEIALSGVSAKVKPLNRRFQPSRKCVKTSGDVIGSNPNSASERSILDLSPIRRCPTATPGSILQKT